MSLVGIIANPASGKDIRRLVAYGSTFDNEEKVRIVRRVLLGLAAVKVDRVVYMPDTYGIVARALDQIDLNMPVTATAFRIRGDQEDSTRAAQAMRHQKAACIVTLGGDGTNRAVAKGAGSVPILPISTGTNNVFPAMIEGTLAGLAAGLVAGKLVPLKHSTFRSTRLEVLLDGKIVDTALVDAAVYDDLFIGSRAIWDMQKVRQVFLNRAEPHSIGISSIGGVIHPVSAEAPEGLYLELGQAARSVVCPVAPGIIQKVSIKKKMTMHPQKETRIAFAPSVLALDGERELEIAPHQKASVRLVLKGPVVVDVRKTMASAVKKKVFSDRKVLERIGYK